MTDLLERARANTLLDPLRWDALAHASAAAPPGGMAEVGVYKGGTALYLRTLRPAAPLWLFDTFAGHTMSGPRDDLDAHPLGRFGDATLPHLETLFAGVTPAPIIVPGSFPASLPTAPVPVRDLALVHLDVDVHEGVLQGLRALWPLLLPGGIVVVDDFGRDGCPGVRPAVEEFLRDAPDAAFAEQRMLFTCTLTKGAP